MRCFFPVDPVRDGNFLMRLVNDGRSGQLGHYPEMVANVLVHHMTHSVLIKDFETLARAAAPHASCCAAFGRLAVPALIYQLEYRSAPDIRARIGFLETMIPAACDALIPVAANGLLEKATQQKWTAHTSTAFDAIELLRALEGTRHLDKVCPDLLEAVARRVVTEMTYQNDSLDLLNAIARQHPVHTLAIDTGLKEGYTQLQRREVPLSSQHGRLERVAHSLS